MNLLSDGLKIRICDIAKELNISIQTIATESPHIFNESYNPNLRVSESMALYLFQYYGKENLFEPFLLSLTSKKDKSSTKSSKERLVNLGSSMEEWIKQSSAINPYLDLTQASSLSEDEKFALLKRIRRKNIVKGTVLYPLRDSKGYFIDILGFRCLLYANEIADNKKLYDGANVYVVVTKAEGERGSSYILTSMKDADKLFNQRRAFNSMTIGQEVEATIKKVEGGYMIVEFGFLSGKINISEAAHEYIDELTRLFKVGDHIKAKILTKSITEEGQYRLTLSRKQCLDDPWEYLQLREGQDFVSGYPIEINDKGIVMTLFPGINGFLPMNEMLFMEYLALKEWKPSDEIIQNILVKEFDRKAHNIILSLAHLHEEEWAVIDDIVEVNKVLSSVILFKDEDRVWVKLDCGLEAFVPNNELHWPKIGEDINDFGVGQQINVLIKDIDKKLRKISCSIKALLPNPWETISFEEGEILSVHIIDVLKNRLKIETVESPKFQGIIRMSEISWFYGQEELPAEMIPEIGSTLSAKVLLIDSSKSKLELSIKQLQPDPWASIAIGTTVKGTLHEIVSGGAIILLEQGLEAHTIEKFSLSDIGTIKYFKIIGANRLTNEIVVSHRQYLHDKKTDAIVMDFFTFKD